jgi:hypothetical protein
LCPVARLAPCPRLSTLLVRVLRCSERSARAGYLSAPCSGRAVLRREPLLARDHSAALRAQCRSWRHEQRAATTYHQARARSGATPEGLT